MCGTCGCSDTENAVTLTNPETGKTTTLRHGGLHQQGSDVAHNHEHNHDHHHSHEGDDEPHTHGPNGEIITLEASILAKNDGIAAQNRGWFAGRGVLALNFVSSPGAGKTTLLERTIQEVDGKFPISVIEGDQMTSNDAERIRAAGAQAIQINTGAGCHLEADMIRDATKELNPQAGSLLIIENVGNLVCPAMFDLGEHKKVAVISTTEGEDKPLKYPHMFRASEIVLINKLDLSPHVEFDEDLCRKNILEINPDAEIIGISAKTGEGFENWINQLKLELKHIQ